MTDRVDIAAQDATCVAHQIATLIMLEMEAGRDLVGIATGVAFGLATLRGIDSQCALVVDRAMSLYFDPPDGEPRPPSPFGQRNPTHPRQP